MVATREKRPGGLAQESRRARTNGAVFVLLAMRRAELSAVMRIERLFELRAMPLTGPGIARTGDATPHRIPLQPIVGCRDCRRDAARIVANRDAQLGRDELLRTSSCSCPCRPC